MWAANQYGIPILLWTESVVVAQPNIYSGTMRSSTGMGCEPNCCLPAEPCLPPSCVLPLGWGWPFVTVITLGAAVYVGGGVAYGHNTMGRPLGATAHPHHDQIAAPGGLVMDGVVFSMTVARGRIVGVGPSTANGLTQSLAAEESTEPYLKYPQQLYCRVKLKQSSLRTSSSNLTHSHGISSRKKKLRFQ